MSNATDTLNMLTLFVRIRTGDVAVQALAKELQQGFTQQIWDTLHQFGVLDARITAVPLPDDPQRFEALMLCTTFQMPNLEYQQVFFTRFPGTFIKLALAAVDSPFSREPLTQEQMAAVVGGDESEGNRALLLPLFDTVRAFIDAHDLTLDRKPAVRPAASERNQFHPVNVAAGWRASVSAA